MNEVHRSKVDAWLFALFALATLVALGACAMLIEKEPGLWWVAAATLLPGIGLPVWVFSSTSYTLTAQTLIVRSGPFRWQLVVDEIAAVTPTRNPLSSPALSLDRLRIDYGRGRWLMISPRDQERFIRDLRARGAKV